MLFFVALALCLLAGRSFAQDKPAFDLIIKKDSVRIEALISEVNAETIRYKKFSEPDGGTFAIYKSEVATIIYRNGDKLTFGGTAEIPAPATTNETYFSESTVPPVVPYNDREQPARPAVPRSSRAAIENANSETLRRNYNFYVKKANTYRTMGVVGILGGITMSAVGIGLIANGANTYNMYGTTQGEGRIIAGTFLFMGGLGAGIPLTVIGFVKKRSYTKKALLVQEELRRRKVPLSMHIKPVYSPFTNTAQLGLTMNF